MTSIEHITATISHIIAIITVIITVIVIIECIIVIIHKAITVISIVIASEHVGTVINAVKGIIIITHIPTTRIYIIRHIAAHVSTCKHIIITTTIVAIIKHIIVSVLPTVSCIVKRIIFIV
jgi:hypothetical protein